MIDAKISRCKDLDGEQEDSARSFSSKVKTLSAGLCASAWLASEVGSEGRPRDFFFSSSNALQRPDGRTNTVALRRLQWCQQTCLPEHFV